MTSRAVIRRVRAREDIEHAAQYYLDEAGVTVAGRFIAAIETAMQHVAAYPSSGSSRYADATGRRGLRFWPVKGFPYLIFYLDRGVRLDVWRVLHAERDIAAWLREGA